MGWTLLTYVLPAFLEERRGETDLLGRRKWLGDGETEPLGRRRQLARWNEAGWGLGQD
jgi:hypothetical protein